MFGRKQSTNRFEMVSKEIKQKPQKNQKTAFDNPSPSAPTADPPANEKVDSLVQSQTDTINPQSQLYKQADEQLEFQQSFSDQQYAEVIKNVEQQAQQAYYAQIAEQQAQQQMNQLANQQVVQETTPVQSNEQYYAEQERALQEAMAQQAQAEQQLNQISSTAVENAVNQMPQVEQVSTGPVPAVQVPVEQVQTVQQIQQASQAPQVGTTTPEQTASANEVALPDTASVLVDRDKKVERPNKKFSYIIINNLGKKEKGLFDAETENDVRTFLINQDYQVLEVKERSKFDIDIGGNKIGSSDLSFCLTQLSTYLKSGIALADSVKILAKQTKKANLKRTFNQVVYQLLRGESFSDAMTLQGNAFPKLLINMVKTAEMTGDLPSILDDMAEYYTSMEQTKKQMKSAMTYPAVVLTIAFAVLIFMLTYLVPQFTAMFESQGAELPLLTKTIIGVSDFIKTKWMFLIAGVIFVVGVFVLCYKKILPFRKVIQIILMHLPVVGNVIIYNETANFSKTFASLLNHSVFITDSMEILSKITTNEVFKSIISKTLENLSKGDSISSAFRGEWAIPVVAYEMIVTGETTGQLGAMMEKVAEHFQMLHKNIIDQLKSLIEPIMICFLAVVVGVILVSIIQPMFAIYGQVK